MAGTKKGNMGYFQAKVHLQCFTDVLAGTSMVYDAIMNTVGNCVYIKFPRLMELIIASWSLLLVILYIAVMVSF